MVGHVDEGRLVAGRYRLMERIGRGGMGTVWLAEDELLGRRVAVKKLHPPQPHMLDEELATLFERTRREARAAARISHPNVIVVHDVVDDAGLPSIVMEYVPSVTLGERLKEHGALPPAEAARIGRGMVAALRAAHRAGVLHRDVKPGNVLLGEDARIVLTDFGIAQASGTSTLTRTGELIGSIDFLSPERIRGVLPGPESDLWALGATLYQAVEGASPFRRPTAIETAYAIAEEPVRPPEHAGALARVIAGLLAKEPSERLSAEDAERMLRIPAAEADTALVDRARFEARGQTTTTRVPHAPAAPYGPSYGGSRGDGGRDTGQGLQGAADGRQAGPPTGPTGVSGSTSGAHQPPGQYDPAQHNPEQHTLASAPRRRRVAPWLAAAAAIAVLAGGAALAVHHFRSDTTADGAGGTTGGPTAPATTGPAPTTDVPTTPPSSPPAVPDGYHLAKENRPRLRGAGPRRLDAQGQERRRRGRLDRPHRAGRPQGQRPGLRQRRPVPALHRPGAADRGERRRLPPRTDGPHHGVRRARRPLGVHLHRASLRDFHAIDLDFGKPGGTRVRRLPVGPAGPMAAVPAGVRQRRGRFPADRPIGRVRIHRPPFGDDGYIQPDNRLTAPAFCRGSP